MTDLSSDETPKEVECVLPREIAEAVGVRPQMIYNYIASGRIPHIEPRPHGRILVPLEAAEEWITGYNKRRAERKK